MGKRRRFFFFESLKSRSIEWSQAISLTGKSAPSTIEVVKAGIEAAQCVVVIFTGDDLAKLKPSFGNEAVMPQPRPNVLFEAGWAFGIAGQEKTILLAFEDFRKISDLDGVTYVAIDNSAPRRKEFIERLKSAGVKLDDSITDIYRPEVAGDFDLTGKTESSDAKLNMGDLLSSLLTPR